MNRSLIRSSPAAPHVARNVVRNLTPCVARHPRRTSCRHPHGKGPAPMRSHRSRARALVLSLLAGLGLGFGLAGCSGLEPPPTYEPIVDPAQLYMRLALSHRAINL